VLTQVHVFPALYRAVPVGSPGETLLIDEESSCFYHPQKKAVVPCDACGRFLCALCNLELEEKNLCPSCLETGQRKNKIKNLQTHRTLYDSIALSISILSMLIWFLTFITAPIIIFMVFRYWKAPGSIAPRTKIRFIAAFIIAGLQLAGWAFFIVSLVALKKT
jgi:hypothetical protein